MLLPKTIKKILDDKLSGSVTLLKRLMISLENELLDPELSPSKFISYIEHVRNKMEMFTVVRHFCDELILSHNVSVRNFPGNYLDFIREYKEFWEHAPQKLMQNLTKEVILEKKTIMLHSNSGTIREVFNLLADKDLGIKIYQTISSPMEEGRVQGQALAEMGYNVTLIVDALAAEKLKQTHLLLLAADQLRTNSIINKIGSLQMALAAQDLNVPAYVLTESRKLSKIDTDIVFKDKERGKEEVLRNSKHKNLGAENVYFEEIPNYLFTRIITEKNVQGIHV